MPKKSRPTFRKRQREMARQQRQEEKRARRLAPKENVAGAPGSPSDEDPDIAGIRPGPQPRPEWAVDLPPPSTEPDEV